MHKPTEAVFGRWSKRLNRWHDEEGPFHLQKDDGSPACGARYHAMTGPYPYQPTRGACCLRCLKRHARTTSTSH